MKRIAFVNQKGGVGKTTTAINVAGFLAGRGYNTLLVDIDPQGNATTGMGFNRDNLINSVYEVLMDAAPIEKAIQQTSIPGLKVLPSNRNLPGCEIELAGVEHREFRLRQALEKCSDQFAYILIDCPPSLGLLTLNGLVAAHSLVIPIQAEFFALEGLSQLLQTYHLVKANLNPGLQIEGILMTMYDGRTKLAREVEDEVKGFFEGREAVFQTKVPRNIRLAEAPSYGLPISHYAPGSLGALAYSDLAQEIISANEEKPEQDDEELSESKQDDYNPPCDPLVDHPPHS